jgi:uncharacterized protein YydD (DUF2326 family)
LAEDTLMLYRLVAGDPRFKALTFREGLNIIAASRAGAGGKNTKRRTGDRQRSRNGVGKTSFVHLVHFLLGGDPDGPLKSDALSNWDFTLELDVGAAKVSVTRPLSNKNEIFLRGQLARLQLPDDSGATLTNTKLTKLLGTHWFGLEDERISGAPTFRSLFPYFARWEETGGFLDATRYIKAQRQGTVDTNLAYLFGFDFELVRRLYKAKEAREKLGKARSALREIEDERTGHASRADLEALLQAELATAALARDRLKNEVDNFRVLPAFRELETELAEINDKDRALSDADVIDRELMAAHDQALSREHVPERPEIERLYQEAQLVFPDLVRRRYDEVQRFHEALVANWRTYLMAERSAAEKRIKGREKHRQKLGNRRTAILKELSSGAQPTSCSDFAKSCRNTSFVSGSWRPGWLRLEGSKSGMSG